MCYNIPISAGRDKGKAASRGGFWRKEGDHSMSGKEKQPGILSALNPLFWGILLLYLGFQLLAHRDSLALVPLIIGIFFVSGGVYGLRQCLGKEKKSDTPRVIRPGTKQAEIEMIRLMQQRSDANNISGLPPKEEALFFTEKNSGKHEMKKSVYFKDYLPDGTEVEGFKNE